MPFNKVCKIFFIIWICFWVWFSARPYVLKGRTKEHSELLNASVEEKKSLIVGKQLYDFIRFVNQSLPSRSTYHMINIKPDTIDLRRSQYYLYPHVDVENPEYLLVFNITNLKREGYELFAMMERDYYILKKKGL